MVEDQAEKNHTSAYIIFALLLIIAFLGWKYYKVNKDYLTLKKGIEIYSNFVEDSQKTNGQNTQSSTNQTKLKECLDNVNNAVSEAMGNNKANLSNNDVSVLMQVWESRKEECYKLYPVK